MPFVVSCCPGILQRHFSSARSGQNSESAVTRVSTSPAPKLSVARENETAERQVKAVWHCDTVQRRILHKYVKILNIKRFLEVRLRKSFLSRNKLFRKMMIRKRRRPDVFRRTSHVLFSNDVSNNYCIFNVIQNF